LARASKNVRLQFIVDLAIAETLDGTGRVDRVESALKDAESLVGSDVKVPSVEPNYLVELYIRLADLHERHKDTQRELIALEKALTPAIALANTPKEARNDKPRDWLMLRLEARIPDYHVRESGEIAYESGHFADALVSFEILQYFQEFDAAWKGKYEEYGKNLNNDSILARLLQIPPKVISQDDGAAILAKNIEDLGPVADRIRLLSLGLLTNYYISHQRLDMVVRFARQALPSFTVGENETPSEWGVAMSCELAYALMVEKDIRSAVEVLKLCMAGAKKLGIPALLNAAHQTNVWVLDAAGKHDEAQESIQFLLKQTPDDPVEYVQLALMKAQQGDWPTAADAWKNALMLYEARKNVNGAADAHFALATLPNVAPDAEDRRVHLEAADELYRQLGSGEGRVRAEAALGAYYAASKKKSQSRQYFEGALSIARNAKRADLEAVVLSQIGQAYEVSGDLSDALDYYGKSADLYQHQNDPVNEALQLRNKASVLDSSHNSDEALNTIMRAKGIADRSNNWPARYWVRREMATIYGNQGRYQDGVNVLREAKQISDDANQPLNSAWAALILASGLETIGSWEEASQQINSAIPVLRQFKDTDDESAAYIELMAIYGARESELKDLSKALEFYQKAYQLLEKTHPERAAVLNLDLTEIYWDQGRFKDAIAKANEALDYYTKLKDELGEASALISLAEAQRSDGDLKAAANSLRLAEPLADHAKNFYTLGRFYYGRAGLYRAEGKLIDAIGQYERVVKMLEQFKSSSDPKNRRSVSEHYDFIYDELIDTYYALAQSEQQRAESAADKALEYAELNKARAFFNSWGHAFVDGLRHKVPVILQDKEATIASEREALLSDLQTAMMGSGEHSVKQVEDKLAKVESAESELEKQLRRTSPAYAEVRYPQRMNIQQIPLYPGELLVQVKMLTQATLVWLFSGTGKGTALTAFYKVDRPRQWFADRVFGIRDAFNGGHPEQFNPRITDELLGALFPDSALQSVKAAKAIIFVPDDILFLLPFEMLSSHGQYLLLGTPTEYFPSSAAFRLARTSIHATGDWQESFIGIADPITSSDDPRYQAVSLISDPGAKTGPGQPNNSTSLDRIVSRGFSLERLPGTADEVHGIASLFASKAETRTGMDATKQQLVRTDLARYKFVHFATHGILPVESGIKEPSLVLSYDGRGKDDMLLTLSEILEFKLRADMVVLSACNTGSGKVTRAEGVASLGSAFLAAGASSVTVSLWHVADNSTAELMEEFYRNLLKGKTKSESLAAARSALVAKGYDNPFFWAPFVLTGE
jgi:CHAT domain-containing protein/tetratricopeptide (TPR) repeat protein